MRKTLTTLALGLLAGLAIAACGSGSSSSSSTTAASSSTTASSTTTAVASGHVAVAITNYAYHPVKLVIKAGTKVTFTNHDKTAHTATDSNSGFDSGTIKPGASATVTFSKPGTYPYICQFHAFMHGTIVVK